jgi:hypothetical protein
MKERVAIWQPFCCLKNIINNHVIQRACPKDPIEYFGSKRGTTLTTCFGETKLTLSVLIVSEKYSFVIFQDGFGVVLRASPLDDVVD